MSADERIRQEILEAQQRLSGLQRKLSEIDTRLDGLGEQRTTYALLEQACGTLEQLEQLGADDLFWGQEGVRPTGVHVRQVRERAESYLSHIGEVERQREAVIDRIKQGQDVLDILETDLFEYELAEEEKSQEWAIEREFDAPERVSVMPWSRTDDEQRLRKSLAVNLLIAGLLGAIIPLIDLPVPEFDIIPQLPDRFARLIERELPPPPPPQVVEEVVPEEVVEPEPEAEPVVAEEVPEIVPEVQEEPAPAVAAETAPEREVRSTGILAFSESFANIREDRPAPALGADARINDAGGAAVGRSERSMVTSQAPGSSGGINLSSLSRNVGGEGGAGQQIEGVAVSQVASSIGVSGSGDRPLAGGAAAGRTDEEIQIVFDRYKSALYRLYNRELRNDPTLRGQVVLQLTIEPNGSVSFLEIRSSDLGSPVLEQQIAERVRSFDFGAKEGITAVTILYPIDFLPAG
jgi:outer membrane biosynthesis protein TonB